MWPEVKRAQTENRYELVLAGNEISERIEKNGLDPNIFQLSTINYLDIHDTNLQAISDDISKLNALQSLVLHSNQLQTFNDHIVKLNKLKLLDLSRNQLQQISSQIDQLINLASLNLANNRLEIFPKLCQTTKLSVLTLSNNKLKQFPDVCYEELINLSEIRLNDNEIEEIPNEIYKLASLKILELNKNKIKVLPGELSDCHKLKTLELKNNPIADRRLLKLVDQCRTKQILDYVKQHCSKKPKEKTKDSQKNNQNERSDESDDDDKSYKYLIKISYPNDDFKVIIDNSVKSVREHFAGCIVEEIKFTEISFKKFIQLQNRLHETICNKRNNATIATHDFNKLPPGPLTYTAQPPNILQIQPLNRPQALSGAELFSRLQNEANNLRKEKKRNTYSGIHKYLYLIEGHPNYPCLLNSQGIAISFPPITNSDVSKIELGTTKLLLEVTSSVSIQQCKSILDQLIKDMTGVFEQDLKVVQVKTTDISGNLRVVYPSKTDLKFVNNDIKVVRD